MSLPQDLAKVLRGVFLVASRIAENRARTRLSVAPLLRREPPPGAASAPQPPPRPVRAPEPVLAAAPPSVDSPAPPTAAPASYSPPAAATPQPSVSRHVAEPLIHSLQGTSVFREETSTGQITPPPQLQQAQQQQPARRKFVPRERAVPSNPFSRAMGFAGLGASLMFGTAKDSISRAWRGKDTAHGGEDGDSSAVYSSFLSESNAERLAEALCRMRGAALKIGQMLSIQDDSMMPPQFKAALERVRAGADVMPRRQLEKMLAAELGPDWLSRVAEFDDAPMAAASIGQVHSARLHDGRRVVLKVQYPGVAKSIESDVDNLMRLVSVANILPAGMYVDNAVKVAKKELALECDYTYEAVAQARFAALVRADPYCAQHFRVPAVVPELSSQRVLASEWAPGVHIDSVAEMEQSVRDAVGTRLLALTLRELYEWRFMQTDPNWGNFLYDAPTDTLHLIDFGAAKEYSAEFVADYLEMVKACGDQDADEIVARSTSLGFLTGDESKLMMDAHVEAAIMVGTPFSHEGIYDFGGHGALTKRITELGAIMLKHRLTPPPDESYSLHRKLSGAFLACIKLKSRVPCRQLFLEAYGRHHALRRAEETAGELAAEV